MWPLMFSQRQKSYKHLFEGDFLREFYRTPNENTPEVHFLTQTSALRNSSDCIFYSFSLAAFPDTFDLISDLPLEKTYPAEHFLDKE